MWLKKPKIVGAVVASGEYDSEGEFTQNSSLAFSAKSLKHENLVDYKESYSLNLGASYGGGKTGASKSKGGAGESYGVDNAGATFGGNIAAQRSKQLATLGMGTVKIGGNSLKDSTLNRDTHQSEKNVYSISQDRANISAEIDTRIFSKKGRKEMKKDFTRSADFVKDTVGGTLSVLKHKVKKDETVVQHDSGKEKAGVASKHQGKIATFKDIISTVNNNRLK